MRENKKFTFIDLFAGIGGFRIAMTNTGGECLYTSEWDKYAQITYAANFKEKPHGDITKIEENDIPAHDVLCGGFPCQAFSISGKQRGFEDTRGTLFFDIARIAKYHKPKILFLENVKNFARHDGGKTLKVVLETLDTIGYDVYHEVMNASHYGAPTARKRIYIVAFRKDLFVTGFEFPKPTLQPVILGDLLEQVVAEKYFIRRDDIKLENKRREIDTLIPLHKLGCERIGTIGGGGQGERIYSIKGHAITLSAYGGGAAAKTGAYLVDNGVRKLTPRECARVMGYPDTFLIPVPDTQAYKQFGNSVALPVITAIANKIIKYL